MQESTICIGKHCYTNKRAALKALKALDRRIQRRIAKAKEQPRYEYYEG
jgi:hypothetical protein